MEEILKAMSEYFKTPAALEELKKHYERACKQAELLKRRPYARNISPSTLDADAPLYRIERFECFKKNIETGTLHFSHPKVWLKADEMDSILLRKKVLLKDGTPCHQTYYEETFCQCWSKKQSEKMWDGYGTDPNFKNVMMVSSIDKLMNAF